MPYAQVAVNAPGAGSRSFSYSLPDELADRINPGHAVIVPFGRHTFQGIVLEITEKPGYSRTRPVDSLIADDPVIAESLIGLGEWIAARYHTPLYTAYRPMLPPAFERRQTDHRQRDAGRTGGNRNRLSPSRRDSRFRSRCR